MDYEQVLIKRTIKLEIRYFNSVIILLFLRKVNIVETILHPTQEERPIFNLLLC